MSKLIIVESPKKVKTIQQYLPSNYKVAASVGHIRDLPTNALGLTNDLMPIYVQTKPDIIQHLMRMATQCDEVIIMTDLDREGEAIGWHLIDALNLKSYTRCATNNLNKDGVLNALAHPRLIDMKQVHSQEARRVLDRLIGYRVSPLTRTLLGLPSAGRVQTTALRLVVEQQELINSFNRMAYLDLVLSHNYNGIKFTSKLHEEDIIASGKFNTELTPEYKVGDKPAKRHICNAMFVQAIQAEIFKRGFVSVKSFIKKDTKTAPPAPFTTSLLLQACSSQLGFGAKKTMATAQALFESGHITYHRTDSTSFEPTSLNLIRSFITEWQKDKGATYLSPTVNTFKSTESAQEGHEPIRPSNLYLDINTITDNDQRAMYELIFRRTIASQMVNAVYEKVDLILSSNFKIRDHEITFIASGRVLKFDGWKHIYKDKNDKESTANQQILPDLMLGESVSVNNTHIDKKTTQAPSRYTEASLIKELEKRGIGRPSTYASIIETLYMRTYTKLEERFIVPTPLGMTTIKHLRGNFQFVDYDYTAHMESELDKIAHGHTQYEFLIPKANQELDVELESFAKKVVTNLPTQPCPICHNQSLLRKESTKTKGTFYWSCFTEHCDAFYPDKNNTPDTNYKAPTKTEFECRVCQKPLLLSAEKNNSKRYFYCTNKSHKFIVNAISIKDKLKPDYDQWDIEHKHKCPTCHKGFLKLNKGKDKFYCSHNQNPPKGIPKCNTYISATTNKEPDFDAYKAEKEAYARLITCPACNNGKLKLTKKKDKYYCSNAFEKGKKQCKTFIPLNGSGGPDIELWLAESSNANNSSDNEMIHRCRICNTELKQFPPFREFKCSNNHVYKMGSDGTPDFEELEDLQKRPYI